LNFILSGGPGPARNKGAPNASVTGPETVREKMPPGGKGIGPLSDIQKQNVVHLDVVEFAQVPKHVQSVRYSGFANGDAAGLGTKFKRGPHERLNVMFEVCPSGYEAPYFTGKRRRKVVTRDSFNPFSTESCHGGHP
jgi:hypothetical protein